MTTVNANANVPATRPSGPADPVTTLRNMLNASQKQIAQALPKHIKAEHMIRVAMTAIQTTPGLLECTQLSIISCVMKAAELGLELSGPLGQAYMIPRYNGRTKQKEATFQIGYKGLMDLTYRSGLSQSVQVRVVYQGDEFSYRLGTRPRIIHVPAEKSGPWTHVYAVLFLRGGEDFEVMSKAQVLDHAARYSDTYKAKLRAMQNPSDHWKLEKNAWHTSEEAMAAKTVATKLLKRAPVSIEVRQAIATDEQSYIETTMIEASVASGGSRSDALAAAMLTHRDPDDQVSEAPTDEQVADQRIHGVDED